MAKYHWYDDKVSALRISGANVQGLLSGTGAPPSAGSGLDPLDGINDPWRWSPEMVCWVGPAYHVTVPPNGEFSLADLPDRLAGIAQMDAVVLSTGTTIRTAGSTGTELIDRTVYTFVDEAWVEDNSTPAGFLFYTLFINSAGAGRPIKTTFTSVEGGTGVAFIQQQEDASYGGPTSVPEPELDTQALLTGMGITVGDPFEFSEDESIGDDGDFYLDMTGLGLYYRDDGLWTKVSTLPGP